MTQSLALMHALATLGALAWAGRERMARPPPRGTWRLGIGTASAALATDALVVAGFALGGLLTMTVLVAIVAAFALILTSLLQGWPSKPLLVVAGLALISPIVL